MYRNTNDKDALEDSNDSSSAEEGEYESKLKKTLSKASRNTVSRIATSKAAGIFIDATYNNLLSTLKKSIAHHTKDSKLAKKIVHNSLKIIVKIAVLERNEELGAKELAAIDLFKIKIHSIVQTMITFYDVEFDFDKSSLKSILSDCQSAADDSMGTKLSKKSHDSLDEIFGYLIHSNYINRLFDKKDSMYPFLVEIVPSLRLLLRRKLL